MTAVFSVEFHGTRCEDDFELRRLLDVELVRKSWATESIRERIDSMRLVTSLMRCIPRFEKYGIVRLHYFLAFHDAIPIMLVVE